MIGGVAYQHYSVSEIANSPELTAACQIQPEKAR